MRGPFDDVIEAEPTPMAREEERRRPPGGKVLLRLLQLLESAGYTETANASVERAVSENNREEFRAQAARFTAAPSGEPPGDRPSAHSSRSRRSRTSEEGGTAIAENVAQMYLEAAERLAPPTPTAPQWRSLGPWTVPNGQTYGASRVNISGRLSAIAIDPDNPAHVLAGAANGGVWESRDRGASWAPRTDYAATLTVGAIAFDRRSPLTVYCGTGEGNWWWWLGAGILRSTDGGTTWSTLCTAPFVGQGFYDLVVDPGDSLHLIAGTTGGLYVSTLRRWYRQPIYGGVPGEHGQRSPRVQRVREIPLVCKPCRPRTIGSLRSRQTSTRRYTVALLMSTVATLRARHGRGSTSRASHLAIQSIPTNMPLLSNQVNQTPSTSEMMVVSSAARTGITWQHCNNGLVISEFEYLAQDYGSSRWLIGGTQDNGTERWTGSAVFEHVADGDGGDCGVNRTNPTIAFHTFYRMSPQSSNTRGNWGSWTRITPPVPMGEGSLFYPPFESSAAGGDTIAIGGDALYVSRNNGTSWVRLAFPTAARSSALYIRNADTVYVGTTDGRVFRTDWNGANWAVLTALTTPRTNAFVSDLDVDPNNANRMWATSRTTGGGRVFRSDDGGSSWTDCTPGQTTLPINAVEVDPSNANRVWIAADLGVYQSTDGGATWTDFSNGLPNMFVGDLLFHPHARVLRVATRNRGIWEIPVDGWMTQPVCGIQWTGSLAGNQTQRWFTWGWPATWHMVWTIMPTNQRPGAPQVSWSTQVERANAEYVTYWITVNNLTPDPLTFEGRYCILSRY